VIPLRDTVRAQSWPLVTYALIGVNVWMFLYELALGPELEPFVRTWGFVPARYFVLAELEPDNWAARYLPLLTSMFLHGGWAHLIGNMIYLWIFGDNVEDRLGHARYLLFYLSCGAAASLGQVASHPESTLPMIGASGAIAGVMGAYFVLYPQSRVLTAVFIIFFIDLIEIPAIYFLGIWFLMQLFSGVGSLGARAADGGIAFWAHVGGFAAGVLLGALWRASEAKRRHGWEH
jgi:membrane associated rhomboid family serine protease